MSGSLVDKVYIGLDNAPAAFDIKSRILGPNGTNLEYIRSETGVVAVLKGDKFEPLHLALHHARADAINAAKSLALNLIETIKNELVQWSAAQAGGPPPALNVPPPVLTTSSAPPPVPPPASITMSTPSSLTSTAPPTVMPPVVSVAPASAPLMTVRQPTVLQFMQPQQQYVLNQETGQLIPIVQPGQMGNTLTSLPIAQQLQTLQQPNFGTQMIDLSSMQPVNVTQLRLSGVPSSMSMILPNGLIPQSSINSNDTTTVSTATTTPVVCAAPITNSQKIFYSTDKANEKSDVKYQIQGTDNIQWTVPGSQTMLIPYQQLQDSGLTSLQPQQFVSIAPAGGLPQTSLPLTAAQLQQLQATGTIMQLNQKSSAQTPTKVNNQDHRGQKRLSDGTPSQLQLRPIAPAGSHVSQEKSSRDARTWSASAGRDNTVVSMGMKINPAHGTIFHVSSGQQTSVSASGVTQDGTGMYIRHLDRNAIQIQSNKDAQKQDITNKIQSTAQNVQMITVPQGMTVLQNPLNIGQMALGQPNSQVYMIPTNQSNLVQGMHQGILGQQMLQPGQNVTVMQPNQLGVPNSVQYNMPLMHMNMQPNTQYVSGINLNNLNNLNTPFSAQQLNAALAGQQLTHANLGTIPIVQAPPPGSPMQQSIPVSQQQQIQQIIPQNSTFITPTSQYSVPQQYVMQQNPGAITMPNNQNIQYSVQPSNQPTPPANNGAQTQSAENDNPTNSTTTNQNNYITSSSQENGFTISPQQQPAAPNPQTYANESSTPPNQSAGTPNYSVSNPNSGQSPAYNPAPVPQVPTTQPPPYNPPSGTPSANQSYSAQNQSVSQANYSPSATPAPQTYATPNAAYPPNAQSNPYPNATGQNMAAYANNQYQYNMQAPSRPWVRPRYSSPQGSPYNSGSVSQVPPPAGPPMPVPPPSGNYSYWQENS